MQREIIGGPWDGEKIDADDVPVFFIVVASGREPITPKATQHRYDLYSV